MSDSATHNPKRYNMNNSTSPKKESPRAALLCWSDLQLIDCINYAYHSSDCIDLFVQHDLNRNGHLINKLKKTGIFSNVFSYNIEHWHYSKIDVIVKTVINYLKFTFSQFHSTEQNNKKQNFSYFYFITQLHIKTTNMIIDGVYSADIESYDKILAPWANDLTLQLLILNSSAEMILYEDGIGSYAVDMFDIQINPHIKKWCDRLNIDIKNRKPSKLFLSNGNIPINCNYNIELLKPFSHNNDFKSLLNNIFDYKPSELYKQKHVIYLTQPYSAAYNSFKEEQAALDNTEKKIITELANITDNLLIRPHPRDRKRISTYSSDFLLDSENNVWELVCANELTENHILIGAISTSQFTPKWWYDIEPWVIFTYDLMIGGLSFYNKKLFENAYDLKKTYRNPEKVIFIRNINELNSALNYIFSCQ